MLEVVQFIGGRYGLRNILTREILTYENGRPRMFRTAKGASRWADRTTRRFDRVIANLGKAKP